MQTGSRRIAFALAILAIVLGAWSLLHPSTTTRTRTRTLTLTAPAPALQSFAGHPCQPADYFMQCAAPPAPGRRLPPLTQSVHAYGVDFGWSGPSVAFMHSAGARFAFSYLSYDSSKNWHSALLAAYHNAGIATVNGWETSATRPIDGGSYAANYANGASDARAGASQAAALGERGGVIYFCVDFDTTNYGAAIVAYFRGVDSILGVSHTGGYGGLSTMRVLFGYGLIGYGFQSGSWSYGTWDTRAQLQQYGYGNSLDWDRALATDYGQWPRPAPPAPPRVHCFGPSRQLRNATCERVRPLVARQSRARDSTLRALNARGCPYAAIVSFKAAAALHTSGSCGELEQRAGYFARQIHANVY